MKYLKSIIDTRTFNLAKDLCDLANKSDMDLPTFAKKIELLIPLNSLFEDWMILSEKATFIKTDSGNWTFVGPSPA